MPPRSSHDHDRRQQKITLGEMRSTGLRKLLVYCGDYKCAHHVEINADRWSDDVRLSDLEALFVCQALRSPRRRRPPVLRPQQGAEPASVMKLNCFRCQDSGWVGENLPFCVEQLMRIPALALLTIATVLTAPPARAQTYDPAYPVCLHVYGRGATYYQCSYTSLPQCNASASGRAAQCVINPYFAGAQVSAHYRRHRRVY